MTLGRTDEIPNRDLIVRYATAGPQTMVGLIAHRIDDEGYFVLTVQPKATYHTEDITPREVMVVIDHSAPVMRACRIRGKSPGCNRARHAQRDRFGRRRVDGEHGDPAPPTPRRAASNTCARHPSGTNMEGAAKTLTISPGNDASALPTSTEASPATTVIVTAAKNSLGTN